MYGITRTTYDIDIVVDLTEQHIRALAAAYPPPRYHADPEQMRSSIRMGIAFNIIDGKRGEKADPQPIDQGLALPRVIREAYPAKDHVAGYPAL